MPAVRCATCNRPTAICVCDKVTPLPCATHVLILQHPAEPDEVLGTAQILAASLPSCRVRTGLSWPSLAGAWGEPATGKWAVLWNKQLPAGAAPPEAPVVRIGRDGATRALGGLQGVVVLDGTWSQAKALWWRNPWLLDLDRLLLRPKEAGIYGRVRREPTPLAVSTLEAVADALVANGEPAETRDALRRWMRTLVQRARDTDPRLGRETSHQPAGRRHRSVSPRHVAAENPEPPEDP